MIKAIEIADAWIRRYDKQFRFVTQYGLILGGGFCLILGGMNVFLSSGVVLMVYGLKGTKSKHSR